jgi:biopolymer transport protein ExbB/TolQ
MSFLAKFFHSFNAAEPGFLFMWVLLVVAVFGLAVVLDRLWFLMTRSGMRVENFVKEVLTRLQKDDIPGALSACTRKGKMSLAHVVKAGLNSANLGADQIRNSIDEATLKVIPPLEKRTGYLATIGNVATLLGLMGTIYGLILSFAAVGRPGIDAAEKSTLLAQGISAAMNTTFMGLMIAIPSIALYSLFRAKTQRIIDEIDEHSLRVLNVLIEKSYRTYKYHISAAQLKEGVGFHVTHNNIKIFTDNKLIKEIVI